MEPLTPESKDEYALRQLREAWKHFDQEMMAARMAGIAAQADELALALRDFTSAVVKLKAAFVTLRICRDPKARLLETGRPLSR